MVRTGAIVIKCMFTSLTLSLGLEVEISTLDHIEEGSNLDMNSCLAQKFIKIKKLERVLLNDLELSIDEDCFSQSGTYSCTR